MIRRDQYDMELLGGIPFEWWHQIDAACDAFFRRRGMPIKGPSLKELIHQEAMADHRKKKHAHSNT